MMVDWVHRIGLILLQLASLGIGVFLIGASLLSAIRTFILPRGAPDQIVRAVFLAIRALFDLRMRRTTTYEQRDSIMAMYAPLALLTLPVVWMLIIAIGYTAIYWGLTDGLLSDAIFLSQSSLTTVGFAPVNGLFLSTLVYIEATTGVLINAILIAYLPTMYAAFSVREQLVSLLDVRAGTPPSPITMFERYHRIHGMDDLHELWGEWEIWFTQLEESHSSLAALAFFRSQHSGRSWITSAGAVLDSAALSLTILDIPNDYQAALTIRAGYLALRQIADFFGIEHNPTPHPDDPISVLRQEFDELCDDLQQTGIPLKADRDQAWKDYAGWRVNYDTVLIALAGLTMAPYAPWSSDRSNRKRHQRLMIKKHKTP
jgi:hypothetical protein